MRIYLQFEKVGYTPNIPQICKNVEKVTPYPYRIAMFPKDA
jgi:hypothetical protein